MKSRFNETISKRTNEELLNILNSDPGDYPSDLIEAAINEAKKRKLDYDYSNATSRLLNERYPRLRFISNVFRVSAYIVIILAILYFVSSLIDDRLEIQSGIKGILAGLILYLFFLAISELIKVIIDIEYNTRVTSMNSRNE